MPPGAGSGLLVDALEAHRVGCLEGRAHVIDFEGEVMEPWPLAIEELGDRSAVLLGFEELQVGTTHVEEHQIEAVEGLPVDHGRLQELTEPFGQAIGVVGCHTDVIQSPHVRGHCGCRLNRGARRPLGSL
jgi:hypothetical protein